MALIVWRRTIFQLKVIGVYRSIRKRYLIVIGKVKRLGKRVGSAELVAIRKTFLETQKQSVVLRPNARLQILDYLWPTNNRIKGTVPIMRPMMKCVPTLRR